MFQEFDSFEEMMAFLREQEEAADRMTNDWQRAIKEGDHFVTQHEDIIIYNQVLHDEEATAQDRESYRHLVRAYSVVVPQGEMGFVHAANAVGTITSEQFEKARALGWPSDGEGFAEVVRGDPHWRRR